MVKFNAGYEPHVGVVVRTLWTEAERQTLSVDKLMSKVLVLSTRRGFRMAMLGVWNNGQGVFGGFTDQPRAYHIRRLLKLPKDLVLQTLHGKDSWELVDDVLMGLEAELTLTTDTYTEQPDHWIPNTGELLPIEKITVKGQYPLGTKPLSQEEKEVVLLGPADPYYEEQPEDHPAGSNIYRNQGTGLGFYGYFTDNITAVLIASFERKQDWVYDEKDSPYQVVYDAAFSDDGGTSLREGCRFVTGLDGTLFFYNDTGLSATRFGVKPLGQGVEIRPGDDYLLRFGVKIDPELRCTVGDGEFVAVYDKKLLWRANLFIAETGKDWNDEHPWDSAENGWNKEYTFQQNGFDLDNLVDGDGEQDMIPYDFTWCNSNDVTTDRVSYDYNGQDSPFVFNYKMDQQKKWLGLYFNNQSQRFQSPLNNATQANSYASTIAPSNDYENYIFVNEYPYSNGANNQGQGNSWAPDDDNLTNNQVPRNIDNISCYPYIPGFNLSQFFYRNNETEVDWTRLANGTQPDLSNHAGKAGGTDCLAFVQRSASYTGTNYTWTVNHPLGETEGNIWWNDSRHGNIRYPTVARNLSWEVESLPALVLPDLSKVMPGDIVYYPGHIMIIASIDIDGNRSDIEMADITLIESTFGNNWGYVQKARTLKNRHDAGRDWIIWRLRTNG